MQYVLIRPSTSLCTCYPLVVICAHPYCKVVTVVGMICQAYNVLCVSESFNARFADVYLEAIDFISIRYVSLTLYCTPFC
jgi:hypothetical protein